MNVFYIANSDFKVDSNKKVIITKVHVHLLFFLSIASGVIGGTNV